MKKKELLYEGKAKRVYKTENNQQLIVSYKDDATAFNGAKKGSISTKGVINNRLTNHLMSILESEGIPTHLIQELNDRETVVKKVTIIPIEVIVRNVAAGSLSKRLGIPEGTKLSQPILEYCYKNDELGDPMINEYHIHAMALATEKELKIMADYAFKINVILKDYLIKAKINLVDFKVEFGRMDDGTVILADEISPDTCRFWDIDTKKKLDKDRFRRDLGNVEEAYHEVMSRISGLN